MAAPAFGSIGSILAYGSGTSAAVPVPASVAANDVILIHLYIETSGLTFTPPSGFTQCTNSPITVTGNTHMHAIFWKRATGADSGTYSVTWGGSSQARAAYAERYTGCITTGDPTEINNAALATSGTVTPAVSGTTGGADRLLVFSGTTFVTSDSWSALTSGFTQRNATSGNLCIADKAQTTAGATGSVTATHTTSAAETAFLVALISPASGLTATGMASAEAFGSHTITPGPVSLTVPAGMATAEAFGAHTLTPGPVTLTATGIASAGAFGSHVVAGGLTASGIPSAEAFGSSSVIPGPVSLTIPAGMATGEAFGAQVVSGPKLDPTGIPSAEAFGAHTVTPGVVVLTVPVGMATQEAFGVALLLHVSAAISSAILIRPAPTTKYDLVCVARVQHPQAIPQFVEVDPIDWTSLTYSEELNRAPTLEAGCTISGLTSPVLQRLRKLAELASELWLYRNGKLIFAGPWLGWRVSGESLTFNAAGAVAYLQMMVIQQDLTYTATDQFAIAAGIINQWQALDYGNFGIDTSGVGTSGINRDITYLAKELNIVGKKLEDLAGQTNGFNFRVDPASRKLILDYPFSGVDRSSGQDAVVFDDRNVTSPNIICSSAPGDVASEAYGTGTSGSNDTTISVQSNATLRSQYGRTAVAATFSNVADQATLDGYVSALVGARSEALLIPGPDVRVTPDSDLVSYDVGDIVNYQLHSNLSVAGAFRIRKRTTKVSTTGQESISAEFV